MTKEDLKNKTEAELMALLKEKRNAMRAFRFRVSKGKAKNVKEGRELRRGIARILTEILWKKKI